MLCSRMADDLMGVAASDVGVVGFRDLRPGNVAFPHAPAEEPFEGLQLAVRQPLSPEPPADVQQIQMGGWLGGGEAGHGGTGADKGEVETSAVEGHQQSPPGQIIEELRDDPPFLGVVAGQVLPHLEAAVVPHHDPDEEERRTAEPGGLDVHEHELLGLVVGEVRQPVKPTPGEGGFLARGTHRRSVPPGPRLRRLPPCAW